MIVLYLVFTCLHIHLNLISERLRNAHTTWTRAFEGFLPSQISKSPDGCRMDIDEDKSRLQRDIKELFGCKLGIESDKITERKVSADPAIEARNGEPASARIKWNSYMHTIRNQLPVFVSCLNLDMWLTTWPAVAGVRGHRRDGRGPRWVWPAMGSHGLGCGRVLWST